MLVLLLGSMEAGKTTFNNALSKVLNVRYNICEESPKIDGLTILQNRTEINNENENITFLDLPRNQDYMDYFDAKNENVDVAVLVLGIDTIKEAELKDQVQCCKKAGIEIACIYVPKKEFFEEEFVEFALEIVVPIITPVLNKNTMRIADNEWGCPIICGDSVEAMENPYGEDGDKVIQVLSIVKTM